MKNSGIFRGCKTKTRFKSMFQAGERRPGELKQRHFWLFLAICETKKYRFHAGLGVSSGGGDGAKKSEF